MRSASLLVVALGLLCGGFSYWGLNSAAGRAQFDEMAGILPLAAMPASFFFLLLAILFWWLADRRAGR